MLLAFIVVEDGESIEGALRRFKRKVHQRDQETFCLLQTWRAQTDEGRPSPQTHAQTDKTRTRIRVLLITPLLHDSNKL